ncbi:uncharacterized protein LOC127122857 [Lathyrus oleraceus]|uniref:uncharacterized protein LOC127122857 n=1 Tax=Pisum sativum TaxID=3888 RepID=UPI0021D312BF|nr:uncharacterized protein LOC127122857 [Pisum sativum]
MKKTQTTPEPSEPIPPHSEPTSEPYETIPPPSEPISEPSELIHNPSEPTSEPSKPDLTFPTIDEVFSKFSENATSRLRKLFEESRLSDNPSEVRTHWNIFLRWMTSGVFKLKGLSEQVRNDYIRGAEERLEARLAHEAVERVRRENKERDDVEAVAKEEAEKAAATEAETKAKAEAKEVARKAVEEATKSSEVALTQCESSISDLAPLVLKTLEEIQKE